LAHAKQEINDFKNASYKNAQRSLSNSKEKTTEYKQIIQHAPIAGLQRARHATNNMNTQIQYAYRDRISNVRIESQKLIQSISSHSKLQMSNSRHLVMEYRRDVTAASKINLANIKSGVFRAKNGLDSSIKLNMHSSKISLLDYHKELLVIAQSATSKQRYILREINYKITNQSIKTLEKLKAKVNNLIERVLILDPKKVLDRGYVLVKDTNNKSIITSALSTHVSQKITLEFKDGSIKANIEGQ
jgi:exodeoxyribonuclease VII large subunit